MNLTYSIKARRDHLMDSSCQSVQRQFWRKVVSTAHQTWPLGSEWSNDRVVGWVTVVVYHTQRGGEEGKIGQSSRYGMTVEQIELITRTHLRGMSLDCKVTSSKKWSAAGTNVGPVQASLFRRIQSTRWNWSHEDMDSPFMGGRMMDSPYSGRVQDSPFLRAQEAKYGSGFSLGPGMHEAGASEGGGAGGGAVDTPQSTADLTAFVQNLLQQMQLRFQSMSDAIIVRNILIINVVNDVVDGCLS
ncbi:hypothetical protein AXG93_1615s1470 [Marchantia polymorpha subsp. ruderalis]|uniref:Uncharacterized protein n=1 Tax=Marchantia polymorpha subsp. ruderalis TaxID=1480154 RepID=A0A176VVP9_MARPO|nr:hypothetical protein AXG93_1615s1470 [Marchantia polymorpha subsp. ruderalis]